MGVGGTRVGTSDTLWHSSTNSAGNVCRESGTRPSKSFKYPMTLLMEVFSIKSDVIGNENTYGIGQDIIYA